MWIGVIRGLTLQGRASIRVRGFLGLVGDSHAGASTECRLDSPCRWQKSADHFEAHEEAIARDPLRTW